MAYATSTSYAPGDTVRFCISSHAPSIQSWIGRTGERETILWSGTITGQTEQAVPDSSFALGCGWQETWSYVLAPTARSGAYFLRMRDPDTLLFRHVAFTVRPADQAPRSRVIYVRSVSTSEAYNEFGGASYYGGPLGIKTSVVSFDRPNLTIRWGGTLSHAEGPVLRLVDEYDGDVIDSVDLHRDPGWLEGADVLLVAYHDEYVSKPVYDVYEAFRDGGGSILFLAANNTYWQIRYSEDFRRQICYKSSVTDPMRFVDPELVTGRWELAPLNRPESALVGISYENWFAVNLPRRSLPAAVKDASHWSWIGTGVQPGQLVGYHPMEDYIGGEWDRVDPWSPPNIDVLLETAVPAHMLGAPTGSDGLHQATYYETTPNYGFDGSSFARVFASGSNSMGRVIYTDPEVTRWIDNLMRACLDSTTVALTIDVGSDVSTPAPGLVAGGVLAADQLWTGSGYGVVGGEPDHFTLAEGYASFPVEALSTGRRGVESIHVESGLEFVLVTLLFTIEPGSSGELAVRVVAEGSHVLVEEELALSSQAGPLHVLRGVVAVTDGVLDLDFTGTDPSARLVLAEFRGAWPDRRRPESTTPLAIELAPGGYRLELDELDARGANRLGVRWLDASYEVVLEEQVVRTMPSRMALTGPDVAAAAVSLQSRDVFGNVSTWSDPIVLPEVTAVDGVDPTQVDEPLLRVLRAGDSNVRFVVRSPGPGASLSIYDTAGRLVHRQILDQAPDSVVEVQWNGVDRTSRPVSRGAYFARLEHGSQRSVRKFVLN